ncbi:MAG: hypothetical protein COY40_01660 [Alphaproteobacteria bacterium CG_4_10_14_0_8_um_filter_53_9]|nr:MAG: hypothetical protein COY40_01660 [Alphaproteobacteria bacterium CG_4_10_14_0_8_um_filter_53_9]
MTEICNWPGCNEEGTFNAPKDPRNLNERQYFCKAHIKEFNKKWNGLTGFSEDELFSMQNGAATWGRPTWATAVNGAKFDPLGASPFKNSSDLFEFFQSRLKEEGASGNMGAHVHGPMPLTSLPADVQEACVIFNLETPLTPAELKPKYLTLVKQHHPDVNKSEHAPDFIKRINVAYKILTDFAERRGLA